MPEKGPKAKAKAQAIENGVLGTLPSTRPERLGAPRRAAAKRAPARPRPAPKRAARPRAVRSGSPDLQAHRAADPPPKPLGAPRGTELVTTAIRATGELAQIGFVVSGQVLKRTLDRVRH